MTSSLFTERDHGLVKSIGPFGLAAAVFNTVVGAGIFVLPAALARDVGPAAPFAYLACTIGMTGVVLCFAAAASRAPTSGGPYGYAEAAFGPLAGFVTGLLVWLGSVLAAAGIAAAIADSLGQTFGVLNGPAGRTGVIALIFALFAAINIAGASKGSWAVGGMTVVKLVPIALLLVVGAAHLHPSNLVPTPPHPQAFGRAMILAAFAFQGMEGALAVSGEVTKPSRNIPLGLISAMVGIAVLYMAIQLVAQGVLGGALATSKAPLAATVSAIAPGLGWVLIVGAVVSMLGYIAGDTLTAPRLLFAFARGGSAPRALATTSKRTGAPYVAIVAHVTIAALLAVTGSFVELAILSSLATVAVYIVSCLAAVVLQRRDISMTEAPLNFRFLPWAAAVGIGGMLLIGSSAKLQELVALAGVVAAGAAWRLSAEAYHRRAGVEGGGGFP